jgi:hypothetical protein
MVKKAKSQYHINKLKHFESKTKDAPIFAKTKTLKCYQLLSKTETENVSTTENNNNNAANYQAELVSLWNKKLENKLLAEVLMA